MELVCLSIDDQPGYLAKNVDKSVIIGAYMHVWIWLWVFFLPLGEIIKGTANKITPAEWMLGVPPVFLQGDTSFFPVWLSPCLCDVLFLFPPLRSHRVMDPTLQRTTVERNSASAGVVSVVKDLHSSSIKVSIVSGDWIRGKISCAISFPELPSTLSVFQRILAL